MISTAAIIRQWLIDQSLGSASGTWPIYVSFLPEDAVHNAIAVYDTAGVKDGRLMATGEQITHPGIQIRVRGIVYPDVWDKANDIALALDAIDSTDVAIDSSTTYTLHNVSRTGDIIPTGVEEEGSKRRHNLTINAVVTVEEAV